MFYKCNEGSYIFINTDQVALVVYDPIRDCYTLHMSNGEKLDMPKEEAEKLLQVIGYHTSSTLEQYPF